MMWILLFKKDQKKEHFITTKDAVDKITYDNKGDIWIRTLSGEESEGNRMEVLTDSSFQYRMTFKDDEK